MSEPTAPNPAAGGSYTRDPVTGELTRVEYTLQPGEAAEPPAPQPEPEA